MSKVTIQATTFVNHPNGEKTYGVRVYDDYDQTYDNTWESIPDDDLDILEKVLESDDSLLIKEMINVVQEMEQGIEINGQYYGWDEIKDCFG